MRTNYFARIPSLLLLIAVTSLVGCAFNQIKGPSLEAAVPPLVDQLAKQLHQFENPSSLEKTVNKLLKKDGPTSEKDVLSPEKVETKPPRLIVLQSLIDSNSHEVVVASRQIEKLLIEGFKGYEQYDLVNVTARNLTQADYILTGILGLEDYRQAFNFGNKKPGKKYRIKISIIDRDLSKIAAHTSVWLSEDEELDYQPVVESVFYDLQDTNDKAQVRVTDQRVGEVVEATYLDNAQIKALLAEARESYYQRKYSKARSLYEQVAAEEGGHLIKAYTGLYRTYIKLANKQAAGSAFRKLLELGVEQNSLSVRLLFQVNNTALSRSLSSEYEMWLREIGQYFKGQNQCMRIIGHASCTGEMAYNQDLSEARAQHIQSVLVNDFPSIRQRVSVEGRGYGEALVCSGTDDEQDAVDRRVDFKLEPCVQ